MDNIYYKLRTFFKKISETILIKLLSILNIKKGIAEIDDIRKIVIPLFAGMGDTLIFTCCLQGLTEIFPKTEITMLTTKRTHHILNETYPQLHYIHLKSILNMLSIKDDYDLMISPNRNIRHYLLALLIHPKCLIGYNYSLSIENGESHIVRANKILNQLGNHHFNFPQIRVPPKTIERSLQLIKNDRETLSANFISFIIGGRWKSKIYPIEKYRQLAEILIKRYDSDILLLGIDSDTGNDIAKGHKKIYNLAGKTSIQEVMGIIHQSQLIIGPDSGLLNIAIAMNKSIVGLFGPVDPHTIVPDQYLNSVLYQQHCDLQPCYNEEYKPRCPYKEIHCMNFRIEDILNKVENILSNKNPINNQFN